TLKSKGFIQVEQDLECKFSDVTHKADVDVKLGTQVIPKRRKFQGVKWRLTFIIQCDKNVPPRIEGKFYRMVVSLTMLYESKHGVSGSRGGQDAETEIEIVRACEVEMCRCLGYD
ncbi:hypothetical protein H5410_046036, partial [Solanum commersonii]